MKPFTPKLAPWGPPVLLGIPLDHNSSFLRGAAQAPPLIRQALHSDAWNKTTETHVDPRRSRNFRRCRRFVGDGDARRLYAHRRFDRKNRGSRQTARQPRRRPLHHLPNSSRHRQADPAITLVHFDAHPDLYGDYEGNPHSHASPFARIMEAQLVHRLIQIGIRTLNAHQYEQAEKYGVKIFEIKDLPDPTHLNLAGPIYVSFDMDALDPRLRPRRLPLGTRWFDHPRSHQLHSRSARPDHWSRHRGIQSRARCHRPYRHGGRKNLEGTPRQDACRLAKSRCLAMKKYFSLLSGGTF